MSNKHKTIYLDHAAATPLDRSVFKAMLPYLKNNFANPSALYKESVSVRKALDLARSSVAATLGTGDESIYFTSGGTESINTALLGIGRANQHNGKHIITTAIEHHAALEPLKHLEAAGFTVTYLKPNSAGEITVTQVIGAIRSDTILVSIMYANNEIGTVLPIHDIGRAVLRYRKEHKTNYPYFFTDACQAANYLDLHVEHLHVDALALNGSKIYGPKGSGVLFLRKGVQIEPIFFGGSQENKLRPGTENVAGYIGFTKALEIIAKNNKKEALRQRKLTEYFVEQIKKTFPSSVLNGPSIGANRLPNNVNITFHGVEGETLVLYLDKEGIKCSTGSACTAVSSTPSHVLEAIGKTSSEISSSLRFTLGRSTTKADLDRVIKVLFKIIKVLKQL